MSEFLHQQPIILASGSAIRYKLLDSLGLKFSVIPSHCDEDKIKRSFQSSNKIELGLKLAETKALAVSALHPEDFVIAADQLCLIGQTILDKPLNHETAIKHLLFLSDKTHQQIACLCIAKNNQILWRHYECAELTLRPLDQRTIETYLLNDSPYQSCGAYQYETLGKWLFKEVKGQEDTILGLPLMPLAQALLELGAVSLGSPIP